MNSQVLRIATGTNVLTACLLLQGCGSFGKKSGTTAAPEPVPPVMPVELQPVETGSHAPESRPGVKPEPIELPVVPMTTPYSVRKGDTISGIAYRYGLRWQDILAVNPGISPRRLRIGQMIQLPGQVDLGSVRPAPTVRHRPIAVGKEIPFSSEKGILYVVKSGDSLSVIAHRYGVKIADLKRANGLKGNRITVGQKLKVPNPSKRPRVSAPNVKPPKPVNATHSTPQQQAPAGTVGKPETPPIPAPPPAQNQARQQPVSAPTHVAGTQSTNAVSEVYTVKEGDDIYSIAIRWGVTPSDLKTLNNITSNDELKPGTVLKIPPHED